MAILIIPAVITTTIIKKIQVIYSLVRTHLIGCVKKSSCKNFISLILNFTILKIFNK